MGEFFFVGEENIFLLKGYVGMGKIFIIKGLIEYFRVVGCNFVLMVFMGKVFKVIVIKIGVVVGMIYFVIYVFDDFVEY